RADRVKKTALITWLQFLQPLARVWGRIQGRQSDEWSGHPKQDAVRVSAAQVLAEIKTLGRREKNPLTFWGVDTGQRDLFLKNLTTHLKKCGYNVSPNEPWDAWDLEVLAHMFLVKIYTAVEHFNQVLRVGYTVQSTNLTQSLLGLLGILL